jgi:hypothetical protein
VTRRLNLVTASSAATAFECSAPWVPGTEWTEAKGWSLRMGSAIHKALEMYLLRKPFDLDALEQAYQLTGRQLEIVTRSFDHLRKYLERAWPHHIKDMTPEVKFAISPDLERCEKLHASGERDYSEAEPWALLACTVDIVWLEHDMGHVFELKTGNSWYPPPNQFAQTLVQSLLVARTYGFDEVGCTLIKATEKECVGVTSKVDVFDLLDVEQKLREFNERSTEPRPGPWCGRCRVTQCNRRMPKEGRAA